MSGLTPVIPAKAGIQNPNPVVSLRDSSAWRIMDSGFRRRDGVGISYAIALRNEFGSVDISLTPLF